MTTNPPEPVMLTRCQREVRETICPRCSHCGQSPHCEKFCPIFRVLPVLLRGAGQLDPMVADRKSAIRNLIREVSSCQHEDSPLYRHQRLLAKVIQDNLPV